MDISKFRFTAVNGLDHAVHIKPYEGDVIVFPPSEVNNGEFLLVMNYDDGNENTVEEDKLWCERYFDGNHIKAGARDFSYPIAGFGRLSYTREISYDSTELRKGNALIVDVDGIKITKTYHDEVIDGLTNTVEDVSDKVNDSTPRRIRVPKKDFLKGVTNFPYVSHEFVNYTGHDILVWISNDTPLHCVTEKAPEGSNFEGKLIRRTLVSQRKNSSGGNYDNSKKLVETLRSERKPLTGSYEEKLRSILNQALNTSAKLRENKMRSYREIVVSVVKTESIVVDIDSVLSGKLHRINTFNVVLTRLNVNYISLIQFEQQVNDSREEVNTYRFISRNPKARPAIFSKCRITGEIIKLVAIKGKVTRLEFSSNNCVLKSILEEDFKSNGWYRSVGAMKSAKAEKKSIKKAKKLKAYNDAILEANKIKTSNLDFKLKEERYNNGKEDRVRNIKREGAADELNHKAKKSATETREARNEHQAYKNEVEKSLFHRTLEVVKTIATVVTAVAASAWAILRLKG